MQRRFWAKLLIGLSGVVATIVLVEAVVSAEDNFDEGIKGALLHALGDFIYLFVVLGFGVASLLAVVLGIFWFSDWVQGRRSR